MDGTATGILRKLSIFNRPTFTVRPVRNISRGQYIMDTEIHRDFIDAVLMSVKSQEEKNLFRKILTRRNGSKRKMNRLVLFYVLLLLFRAILVVAMGKHW